MTAQTEKGQHTPGPWRYEDATRTIRSVPTNFWLATMGSWDGAVDNEANARLIAAAPALLEALQALYQVVMDRDLAAPLDEYGVVNVDRLTLADRVFTQARAAIKLAQGEKSGEK